METKTLTIRLNRENLSDGRPIYVALCLELDLACQGATADEAVENVTNAVTSFFEVASPSEIKRCWSNVKAEDKQHFDVILNVEAYNDSATTRAPRRA